MYVGILCTFCLADVLSDAKTEEEGTYEEEAWFSFWTKSLAQREK